MNDKRLPRACTEQKIRDLISDYDEILQTRKTGKADGRKREEITMIAVPTPLVEKVRALIAREQRA